MKTSVLQRPHFAPITPKPHFLDGLATRAVHARLAGLQHGVLVLRDELSDETSAVRYGKITERCQLTVTLRVHDPRFYSEIAFGGSIGAGEAYMQGYWSVDDLTGLM